MPATPSSSSLTDAELIAAARASLLDLEKAEQLAATASARGLTPDEWAAVTAVQTADHALDQMTGRFRLARRQMSTEDRLQAFLDMAVETFRRRDATFEQMVIEDPSTDSNFQNGVRSRESVEGARIQRLEYARAISVLTEAAGICGTYVRDLFGRSEAAFEDSDLEGEIYGLIADTEADIAATKGRFVGLQDLRTLRVNYEFDLVDASALLGRTITGEEITFPSEEGFDLQMMVRNLEQRIAAARIDGKVLWTPGISELRNPEDPIRVFVLERVTSLRGEPIVEGQIAVGWGRSAAFTGEAHGEPIADEDSLGDCEFSMDLFFRGESGFQLEVSQLGPAVNMNSHLDKLSAPGEEEAFALGAEVHYNAVVRQARERFGQRDEAPFGARLLEAHADVAVMALRQSLDRGVPDFF